MTDSPDQIRADIEKTRRELGGDVDALADKVSPSKIVDRQADKVKHALGSVRDKVMGAADDTGEAISDAGSSVAEHVVDAKDKVVAKAEGNPLAVGLIAFGVGLLAASLVPASAKEKKVAAEVKDQAQPLIDEVADVAKDIGANLKEPVQHAAAAVKDVAVDSAETVKAQTQDAAAEVTGQAKDAAAEVKNQVPAARENVSGY
ncbi:DUF3618 domain-containing protein [Microbacterium sp. P5_E9]